LVQEKHGVVINKLLNKLENLGWLLMDQLSTYRMRLSCKLRGITLTDSVHFYGSMVFKKQPQSVISIGHHVRFRNRYQSNLIGINHPCIFSTHAVNAKIIVGEGCGFSGTTVGAFVSIEFGKHVRCGANTLITDGDWHLDDPRVGDPKPVVIGDHVWLGYGVVVMKGVTIGENSIVGAGSVVVKDIPANCIAAGNPCKVIKMLS
jgi:acetyltransferase-like isoleucine patch superfamily enzyme